MGEPRLVGRADVIRHYATLAPVLLPYLHDRPVNLRRFPDGIDARGFWHKARPDHAPDFVDSWRNVDADPGETETYSVLANPAAIAWAANFDAMELHPWTSTGDRPHRPRGRWSTSIPERRPASTTSSCSLDCTRPHSTTSASRPAPR
jgi:bifunctional non-homologous end joining protein LigD